MGLAVFAIWALIFIAPLTAYAKKNKQAKLRHSVSSEKSRQTKLRHDVFPVKSKAKAAPLYAQFEDRENDWLAKQCKEEARIMRSGDFLDLGARHHKDCDAQKIKALHLIQHDDSIDDGEL